MLESVTIFHKGGLIVYQNVMTIVDDEQEQHQRIEESIQTINTWFDEVYWNPTQSLQERKANLVVRLDGDGSPTTATSSATSTTASTTTSTITTTTTTTSTSSTTASPSMKKVFLEWYEQGEYIVVAISPHLGPHSSSNVLPWVSGFLQAALTEYLQFLQSQQQQQQQHVENDPQRANTTIPTTNDDMFDKTFLALMQHYKKQQQQQQQMATTTSNTSSSKRTTAKSSLDSTTTTTATTNKGKETPIPLGYDLS